MRRAVVTGIGVLCAIGRNVAEFRDSIRLGRDGAGPLHNPEPGGAPWNMRFTTAAQVRNFNATDHFDPKTADMLDRFAQFAVVAGREAIRNSGIEWTPELRDTTAIVTGSCIGGQSTEDKGFVEVYRRGRPRPHPMTIPKTMANAGASALAMEFGITGPSYTVATACASSNHAVGLAANMVRSGMCDVALAGGSEATFSEGVLLAWEAMRVVSPTVCRPFSKDRNGMMLGEGAAMLVIESLEHAEARGAQPLAEIAGFGMSSDAHHVTQPSAEGAARAISRALADARLAPDTIGYVNAHGTGTTVNDATETWALHLAFGDHARRLPVSSTKSMHGHTLGAAGAIESSATILALREGFIPPTIHYNEPDPECDLDYVPNASRAWDGEYAISNSFAFGGLNAVLVLRRMS
ncbi:MAG TPA: beta-ketoacyl-[acyl-carrier-protein] synthase family protein [Bryobacteraceae bacterium]|nr:beta-ketoacyl-[acyl-carrier-protein] synthase family protein [Bryobacteraceae bacterium]